MPRLIDAEALLDKLNIRDLPIRLTFEILEAPTIDAVPVVRCRECKFFVKSSEWGNDSICQMTLCSVGTTDYCSDGQRRKDGTDA